MFLKLTLFCPLHRPYKNHIIGDHIHSIHGISVNYRNSDSQSNSIEHHIWILLYLVLVSVNFFSHYIDAQSIRMDHLEPVYIKHSVACSQSEDSGSVTGTVRMWLQGSWCLFIHLSFKVNEYVASLVPKMAAVWLVVLVYQEVRPYEWVSCVCPECPSRSVVTLKKSVQGLSAKPFCFHNVPWHCNQGTLFQEPVYSFLFNESLCCTNRMV